MSDAVRELFVSIEFDKVDFSNIDRLDRSMDSLENNIRDLGGDIDRMGTRLDSAGREGTRSMDRLETAANGAESDIQSMGQAGDRAGQRIDDAAAQATKELREMGNAGDRSMDEIRGSAARAEDAIDQVGDATANAGDKAGAGGGKILDVLGEVVPQGRAAGMAAMLFSNPWVLAGVAVVAAIGGVGLALASMANETDMAMDRIEALTGTSGTELKGLQDTAKEVFNSGFGESLTVVGDDLAALNGKFKDLDDDGLGKLMTGLYTLQDLWPEADINGTSQAIKTMKANFDGLSETDAMDLITYAFQNGGDYAGDLLDTMKEYSPYFSKMGVDAEKMTGILLRGAEAGAWNMDKVGDSVKEFGIRSMDGSKATNDAFKALGFNAEDMGKKIAGGGEKAHSAFMATIAALSFVKDKQEQATLGVSLFGTQWEDVREDVIFAMDGAEKAVEGFEGATTRAGDAVYDNFGSKWEQVSRTIKSGLTDAFMGEGGVGSGFMDTLIDSLPTIMAGIESFAGWFGTIFGSGGNIGQYLDGFINMWSGIWDVAMGVWNIVGPFLTETLSGTFGLIFSIAGTVLGALGDIFSIFGNVLQGDWAGAWQSVKDLFSGILNGVINIAKSGLELLFGIWDSTTGRIIEAVTGIDLTQAGQDMINGLINGVRNMKDWAVGVVKDLAKEMWGGFKDFFGINSPSRLMMEGGGFIVEGMEVGISDAAAGAIGAARDVSQGIASAMGVQGPQMASQAPTVAPDISPSGVSGGGMIANTISAPITINLPAGTTPEDAQDVAVKVREELQKLFTQLGIKFA